MADIQTQLLSAIKEKDKEHVTLVVRQGADLNYRYKVSSARHA